MVRPSRLPPSLACAVLLSLSGCQFLKTIAGDSTSEPEYSTDPKVDLERGMEAQRGHNFTEAEKYFEFVKTKFPFSDTAREAELRLADNSYEKEEFTEAKDRYTNFVKQHPTHPKVDYAAFRAAFCHYQEFRKEASDFFIFPPTYEKDQSELKSALQSMGDFVRDHAKSSYLPQVEKLLGELKRRLAAHEMYVAEFYYKRAFWAAAAGRWEGVAADFPQLDVDRDALFHLYGLYRDKLHEPQKAEAALRKVVERYPNTAAARRAQALLGKA